MGEISLKDFSGGKMLTAAGRLTIQDASKLKDRLMEAYNTTMSLFIDLTGAESIDLACIQVFCSAHRSFLGSRKSIDIVELLPKEVERTLKVVAVDPANCILGSPEQCLWVTGGSDE